jgi:hypothetical protein
MDELGDHEFGMIASQLGLDSPALFQCDLALDSVIKPEARDSFFDTFESQLDWNFDLDLDRKPRFGDSDSFPVSTSLLDELPDHVVEISDFG